MKSITEFAQPILKKVSTAKAALTAEGKTPEEISAAIGESFKYEGDKLKYVLAASDLIEGKDSVRRVMVSTFAEGETVPTTYQKVDDTYYLIETLNTTKYVMTPATKPGRGAGGPRKQSGGPKSSPWGMSPEELAAKKKSPASATPKK